MDITETTAPRSDQLNFDDFTTTSRTVTVSEVRKGTSEQPVEIHLVEFPGRPFKPSKTVRRVLGKMWGPETNNYAGRRMTLYGDPTVRFGGKTVGGIRVSHLSHIEKEATFPVTTTRGQRADYTVKPLATPPPEQPDGMVTKAQLSALATEYEDKGLTSRDQVLEFLEKTVGHPVKSSKELTEDEAAKVLAELAKATEPAAAGEPA
ncbi:hypothetical protein CH249_25845 [Rhodococcus sp. 05-2255-3B1]|uniref:hypothetical protein n=1 Tax=Rhodococcus sp. 05-2255-3B1 TaxID=2022482 RepID=UPI000B9BB17E|nr:hypothetical protein [Rhodococcus sp. 05-2255-3B1]OZE04359.1 hypothetical protein CH249_25845 [Rhodococcus sp. 05-2255-3B1]